MPLCIHTILGPAQLSLPRGSLNPALGLYLGIEGVYLRIESWSYKHMIECLLKETKILMSSYFKKKKKKKKKKRKILSQFGYRPVVFAIMLKRCPYFSPNFVQTFWFI